ncbi:MAG: CHASE2 domain-containing protein [Burkholderiaceae bacterium]
MRRLLSKNGLRWSLCLLLTLLACTQVFRERPIALVDRIELYLYDTRMNMMPATLDDRIVIVDIDEKSLSEIGRWPWGRDVIAALVDKLADRYQAKSIGFDVMFSEPDTSSGYAKLEALANHELKNIPNIGERIHALKSTLDFDGRLAKSLKSRPVVLGYAFSGQQKKGMLPAPAFSVADLEGRNLYTQAATGYIANLESLQRAANTGGFINATDFDADGVLRSTPLLMQMGDNFYESLALATARVALGAAKIHPMLLRDSNLTEAQLRESGALDSLSLDTPVQPRSIPIDLGLTTKIQFRGHGGPDGGAFRYVSAADIIKGRLPPAELSHKIFLIGTTASGLYDLRSTPVNPAYPGVEVHANIIASILDDQFKQQPSYSVGVDLAQIVLLGILLTVVLSKLTPLFSILFTLGTTIAVAGFNFWMYQVHNSILPMATVLLLILALFMLNIAWGYWFEFRKGRALANRFSEYVAPELVAQMAENPETYTMEGELKELTIMFADVRDFTTISESLEPNELREFINIYLTAMSENIRDSHQGTLDKYIGDCVMAFWGAPVSFPDHATRAVASALLMQQTAAKLNLEFLARSWPPLKIGIGLNTGPVRVGDMGSKIRRAYTVMGDAVNLSSRLEGITKIYGVGIVVGEATKAAAPIYTFRELDRVRVKGKNEPVAIFEPIALNAELTASQRAALTQWQKALDLFRAQEWDQAEEIIRGLQKMNPQDVLYKLYLDNIAEFKKQGPGMDWDGVTTYKTK